MVYLSWVWASGGQGHTVDLEPGSWKVGLDPQSGTRVDAQGVSLKRLEVIIETKHSWEMVVEERDVDSEGSK